MEKNQVLIDLKDYNDLRDFKKAIEADHTIDINTQIYWNGQSQVTNFGMFIISKDDAVKKIGYTIKELKKNYENIISQKDDIIENLNNKLKDKKNITIDDIKKMSYWEFRKWRKQNK